MTKTKKKAAVILPEHFSVEHLTIELQKEYDTSDLPYGRYDYIFSALGIIDHLLNYESDDYIDSFRVEAIRNVRTAMQAVKRG